MDGVLRLVQRCGIEPFPFGHPLCLTGRRAKEWAKLRNQFVLENPVCLVSGLRTNIEVHHAVPFHVNPGLELAWENLRTVSRPYHFLVGHLCSWSDYNPDFDADAAGWREKIAKSREAARRGQY